MTKLTIVEPTSAVPTIMAPKAMLAFKERAQDLAQYAHTISKALRGIRSNERNSPRQPASINATIGREAIDYLEVRGVRVGTLKRDVAEHISNANRFFAPEGVDDEQHFEAHASFQLALLTGSYPASNVPNPAVYAEALVDEVLATTDDLTAVYFACQRLRRTLKFTPSIAEVVTAIKDEEAFWRAVNVSCADQSLAELIEITGAYEAKAVEEKADRERQATAAYEQRQRYQANVDNFFNTATKLEVER